MSWPTLQEQIEIDPTNVWLTSFWGWSPEAWGCVGFDRIGRRNTIMRDAGPGSFWVCYVTEQSPDAPKEMRGKVVGFYQLGDETGHSSQFIEPEVYERFPNRWENAVRAVGAWTVDKSDWQSVRKFASDTYFAPNGRDRGRTIGRDGIRLKKFEAEKLLGMNYKFVEPYSGSTPIQETENDKRRGKARAPSRPGPAVDGLCLVDRSKNTAKELYVLELTGGCEEFLGRSLEDIGNRKIIKVGLSHAPFVRCQAYNASLPLGRFQWRLIKSTSKDGDTKYKNHNIAVAGEQAMKDYFMTSSNSAESLEHEFFLADNITIANAWQAGCEAAVKKAAE